MMSYERIYLEVYINNQYIWLKNNTTQLYFILGRADLYWDFSSIPKDGSDIHGFANWSWSLVCRLL